MTGSLAIVGLGPGPAYWIAPEASAALETASDVVGYWPYLLFKLLVFNNKYCVRLQTNR